MAGCFTDVNTSIRMLHYSVSYNVINRVPRTYISQIVSLITYTSTTMQFLHNSYDDLFRVSCVFVCACAMINHCDAFAALVEPSEMTFGVVVGDYELF